jgi:hypothetical protein
MKKTVCQTLACYCAGQNCLMQNSGKGCAVTCKSFLDQGLHEHLIAVVNLDKGGPNDLRCPCKVCQCDCQKSFSSHLYATIAFDLETQRMGVDNKKLAPRLDVGQLITSQLDNAQVKVIQDSGFQKYMDLDPEKNSGAFNQDTLTYALLGMGRGFKKQPDHGQLGRFVFVLAFCALFYVVNNTSHIVFFYLEWWQPAPY